jgi:hypothetical protein
LLEAGPLQLARQARTDLQMPLRQPAVTFVDGSRFGELCLPLAFAIGGKIQPGTRPRSRP